ncbi:MAG: TlpA disulfide reductase family protein [Pseudomonadota bacterium]
MLRALHRSTLIVFALMLGACSGEQANDGPQEPTLTIGQWHAEIELPGGNADFGLELSKDDQDWKATIINGSERIAVPEVSFDSSRLSLRFPAFNNRIDAILVDGTLKGSLTLVKRYGKTQVIPFRAAPGARTPGSTDAQAMADLSGRWAVTFTEDDGSEYPAIGEFQQRGNKLLGTFLTETGDYRYLGGSMRGDTMRLSTFDGAHAFLFEATLAENGDLNGRFWSGNQSLESWTARRNADVTLADPASLTFLKEGYETFEFTFPDLEGNSVSLSDPAFDGKVILVTLAGSWCPNCHDEAALMSELYPQYKDKGVEVIALMYEHLEDESAAIQQVRHFRDKFDIQYTTLLAGISDKTRAAETLPALSRVLAFPTTIFIDREGNVRAIHTGFSGPGTGEHYIKQRQSITDMLDELVAESDDVNANEEDA